MKLFLMVLLAVASPIYAQDCVKKEPYVVTKVSQSYHMPKPKCDYYDRTECGKLLVPILTYSITLVSKETNDVRHIRVREEIRVGDIIDVSISSCRQDAR